MDGSTRDSSRASDGAASYRQGLQGRCYDWTMLYSRVWPLRAHSLEVPFAAGCYWGWMSGACIKQRGKISTQRSERAGNECWAKSGLCGNIRFLLYSLGHGLTVVIDILKFFFFIYFIFLSCVPCFSQMPKESGISISISLRSTGQHGARQRLVFAPLAAP
jgi:hypothetical protein